MRIPYDQEVIDELIGAATNHLLGAALRGKLDDKGQRLYDATRAAVAEVRVAEWASQFPSPEVRVGAKAGPKEEG